MAESTLGDELLTHTDWLRRLARELVRDQHTADDLAQGSLSAALATPPRERGPGLQVWLRRVLVNRFRQDRRNRTTRARLQRNMAGAGEVPSTLTLVARREIQTALVQALLALEEPYRATILHRYYDNRSAADIARAENLPESTVRNRLQRGLERLRNRLRNQYGGDDAHWLPAVVALGLPRADVLLRLATTHKLALVAVSLLGLVLLGTVLTPFGRAPVPPAIASRAGSDEATRVASGGTGPRVNDPGGAPSTLERAALDAPAAETFEVRVLAADGSPAAQALVRFVPLADAQQRNLLRGGPAHPHSEIYRFAFLAEAYGQPRQADDEGRVWLPVTEDRTLVSALLESAFAARTIPGEQRNPVTVRLAPDETLELRSVLPDGQAAGNLPLRVAVRVTGEPDNTLWIGESDVAGVATVPHFQLLRPPGHGATTASYGACFDFPIQPHVTVGFEDPLPAAPVVLVVPPHGMLELTFTDAEGGPLSSPVEYCRLDIDFAVDDGAADALPSAQRRWVGGFRRAGEHILRLPIGLGAHLSASGQFNPLGEIEAVSFAGPSRPGELVTGTLRLSPGYAVVRGVLRHEGVPLSSEISLRAVLMRGTDQSTAERPTRLAGGAFELLARARPEARPTRIYLHTRDAQGHELGSELSVSPAAVMNLGAVELAPLAKSIEGTVFDDRGQPVAGAEIQTWRLVSGQWTRDRRWQAVAESDGRFRLFTPESELGLGLLPQRRGYLVNEPTLPGPEPLTMVRAAEMSGSLLAPEWLEPSALSVVLVPVAGAVSTVSVRPQRGGNSLEFSARNLWPGRYRLAVQLEGEPEPFAVLGLFDVVAGEVSARDRLRRIDLRDDVFRLQLAAVDELGTPLDLPGAGLTAFVPRADGSVHKRNLRWTDGLAEVVTSHRSLEIEFVARGYATWRRIVQPGPTVMQLTRER